MNNVFAPTLSIHSLTLFAVNSGPLSDLNESMARTLTGYASKEFPFEFDKIEVEAQVLPDKWFGKTYWLKLARKVNVPIPDHLGWEQYRWNYGLAHLVALRSS
jgi:hypothetical protein